MKPSTIVILGLSITSSWGNGHATIFRALVRALSRRGHEVIFLERDVPWYAGHRDLPAPPWGRTILYRNLEELRTGYADLLRRADLVIVGSYVPEGVEVGRWVIENTPGITAFYDIDTPVTLAKLSRQDYEYLSPDLIPFYDLYLSFTSGPSLKRLEEKYGSPAARAFHCCVDPEGYYPEEISLRWDLGYLGTYSSDRQPTVDALLGEAALAWPEGRFVVAGPQFPESIDWPGNVNRIQHLPPGEHRTFYNSQRFTLNVTRGDMIQAGWSPSVRLFEAAACGTPIISDWWPGLGDFFEPEREILIARTAEESLLCLREVDEGQRREIAGRARARVLREHTAEHRVRQLEKYFSEVYGNRARIGA